MSRDSATFERTIQEAIRRAKLIFAPRAGNISPSGNASTTESGYVPPSPNDPTQVLTGGVPPAWGPVSVSFKRTTQTIVTSSIANLAVENGNAVMPDTLCALLTIQADKACWVRLYSDGTSQSNDAARAFGTQPTAGTGVLAEFVYTGASTIPTSPVPWLSNDEGSPLKRVFYTIQNRSGSTGTVTVTLGYGSLV